MTHAVSLGEDISGLGMGIRYVGIVVQDSTLLDHDLNGQHGDRVLHMGSPILVIDPTLKMCYHD